MATILAVAQSHGLPRTWRRTLRGSRAPHRVIGQTTGADAELLAGTLQPDLDTQSLVAELIGRPEARRLKEELGSQPRVYYLT